MFLGLPQTSRGKYRLRILLPNEQMTFGIPIPVNVLNFVILDKNVSRKVSIQNKKGCLSPT